VQGKRGETNESGVSLVMVGLAMSVLATLSVSMMIAIRSTSKEKSALREEVASLFASEAGLSEAVFALNSGDSANLGTQQQPMSINQSFYWVTETDLVNGMKSLVSSGIDNRAGTRVELTVRQSPDTLWSWAAFGDEELTMDQNALVDSYDSTLGIYDSQQVNGAGSNAYALTNGDVGSNGDVDLSGNTLVYGDATPGPSGTTSQTGTAQVSGSTTPNAGVVALPPLVVPSFGSMGNLVVNNGSPVTLAAGDYEFTNLVLDNGGLLTITGPARVVTTDMQLRANSSIVVDASAGPVKFYVHHDFVLQKNTSIASTTYDPADLSINLESDNIINPTENIQLAEVLLESNSVVYGTIFAPNAMVDIDSNFELFGGVVARQVHLDSWSRIHYDENLANSNNASITTTWEAVCWRRLAFQP
jgi:hypothetical protein